MQRYLNTEGLCIPKKHYMVNLHDRLERIKSRYVDRGRQYGKTTTLRALAEYLKTDYLVVSMDFQMISTKNFESEERFAKTFAKFFVSSFAHEDVEDIEKLAIPVSDFIRKEDNDSICKRLDEELSESKQFEKKSDVWTDRGVMEAAKSMLNERIPLFESMTRQLTEYPEIKQIIHAVLFEGRRITYNIDNPMISLASMFGYIVNHAGAVQVSNRIFEMCLYNLFLSEDELASLSRQ